MVKRTLHGNSFDGFNLVPVVAEIERLTGVAILDEDRQTTGEIELTLIAGEQSH
jgi:hypothetical protein